MNLRFSDWLKQAHPNVLLTPMQNHYVTNWEKGYHPVWTGGRLSGHTFVQKLWQEYVTST